MSGYITSVGTANPPYRFSQSDLANFMAESAGMNSKERQRLTALYRTSGIKYRHSVIPDFGRRPEQYSFFSPSAEKRCHPKVSERMHLYRKNAPELAVKSVINCLNGHSHIRQSDITHLITVSCTGMYAPGLDIDIIRKLKMSFSVQRTSVNFMGCYAAFNGLKLANAIVQADSKAVVMVVCVELCTLHYIPGTEEETMLSNALFADGAAAALVQSHPDGQTALKMSSSFCDLLPDGSEEMSWEVQEQNFGMRLSSYVPDLLRKGVGKLSSIMINKLSCRLQDVDLFAIHPGGKKILEVTEEELGIEREDNKYAWEIMAEHGNMSSATILYVLKRLMNEQENSLQIRKVLTMAFGPGLTLESMFMELIPKVISVKRNHGNEKVNRYEHVQSKVG